MARDTEEGRRSEADTAPTPGAAPSGDAESAPWWRRSFWARFSGDHTRVGVLIGVVLLFTLMNDNFFNTANLTNIMLNASVVGILAFALTLLLIARQIDLSVGSAVGLTSAVFAIVAINQGLWVAAGAALLTALAIAGVNAFAIVYLGVSSIIATLAGFIAYRGMAKLVLDGNTISVKGWTFLGRYRIDVFGWFEIPIAVLCLLLVFAFFTFLLKRTRFGTHMYAIGANPEAARLRGIGLEREVSRGFLLSGLAVFLASMIVVSLVGIAGPTTGSGSEFLALTAVILGGVGLAGGRGTMVGTLIAVLILAVLDNGLVLIGIRSFWQEVARGGLLLAAVAYDQISRRSDHGDVRMSI